MWYNSVTSLFLRCKSRQYCYRHVFIGNLNLPTVPVADLLSRIHDLTVWSYSNQVQITNIITASFQHYSCKELSKLWICNLQKYWEIHQPPSPPPKKKRHEIFSKGAKPPPPPWALTLLHPLDCPNVYLGILKHDTMVTYGWFISNQMSGTITTKSSLSSYFIACF